MEPSQGDLAPGISPLGTGMLWVLACRQFAVVVGLVVLVVLVLVCVLSSLLLPRCTRAIRNLDLLPPHRVSWHQGLDAPERELGVGVDSSIRSGLLKLQCQNRGFT